MGVRTKICGIRSGADLEIALDAGVDAVGFISGVTHRSEDALRPERAAELAARVPPFVSRVLVTHLEQADRMLELATAVGADTIQVHGLVELSVVREVFAAKRFRVVKAVHVTGAEAVEEALRVAAWCDAVLLDSRTSDRLGGTGRTHDWTVSREIVARLAGVDTPVVLAGGLTPDNVATAIAAVRPYGVDVNSGVEDIHGDKSAAACRDFVSVARTA